MRKIISFLIIAFAISFSSNAQPITDTLSLRSYINTVIVPNGNKQITAAMLNRIENGHLYSLPRLWIDSVYSRNDSLFSRKFFTERFIKKLQPFGSFPNLHQVTSVGNITSNDIYVKSVGTNLIKPNMYTDAIGGVDANYEVVIFPDLQNMIRYGQDQSRAMFDWLRDSADNYAVKAVLQVGDVTDWNTSAEWDTLDNQLARFTTAQPNIPYLFVPGNHDYGACLGGCPSGRDATMFNAHLGPAHFSGKSFYQGNYGGSNENYWIKFGDGLRQYAVIGLEFLPRDAVLDWAENIIDSLEANDPDRQVMIVTHAYITKYGELATDTSYASGASYGMSADNSGQELWDKLIRKKKNIRWVFSGHFLIPGVWAHQGLTDRIVSVGDHGNLINQIFVNYQDDDNHGDGYFMRLQFSNAEPQVRVRFWSPYFNQFDSRVEEYVLEDPTLDIQNSVGIRTDAAVSRDFRVGGELKVESLEKGGIIYTGDDHQATTSPNFRYHQPTDSVTMGIVRINKHVLGSNTRAYMNVRDSNNAVIYEQRAQLGSMFLGLNAGSKYNIYDPLYYTEPAIGIGYNALANAVGGHRLIAIGFNSLYSLPGSGFPSATVSIGTNSGFSATLVNDALLIGNNSASGATTINTSVIMGSDAALSIGTVVNATITGSSAARQVTGAGLDSATLYGRQVARNATSARRSVAIGFQAAINETNIDDLLWIQNSATSSPLIKGHFVNSTLGTPGQFGVGTYTPVASAKFEVVSTTQGALLPRMNGTQQAAISSPATGLIIYNTDSTAFCFYNGSAWIKIGGTGGGGGSSLRFGVSGEDDVATGNRFFDADFNNFQIQNIGTGDINAVAAFGVYGGTAGILLEDTMKLIADDGVINIPVLATAADTTLNKPATYNISTKRLEYLPSWPAGGGSSATVGTYSTRIGLSPSDGDEFFQTDVNRDAPYGKYYYLNSAWHYNRVNEEAVPWLFCDFKTVGYANAQVNEDVSYGLGNGGGTYYGAGHGVVSFGTGTATNGFSGVYQGYIGQQSGWCVIASGAIYYKVRMNIPTLSTGTEEYNINAGIQDGYGGEPQNGVYVFYDRPTSTNWLLKASQFTVKATTTSGVAVSTGWHTIEILINAAGTSAEAWVDGTSLGTISSNIPVSGAQLSAQATIAKTAGTTSREMLLDYIKAWQSLTSPRN